MHDRRREERTRRRWFRILPLAALALGLAACPSTEERIEEAEKAVPEALARGDRNAARLAVAELGTEPPETAEELLRIAALMEQAGETPRAFWLLEQGAARHPDNAAVQLALARVAMLVSNPALARDVAARIPSEAPEHLEAMLLQSHAELGLGNLEAALAILEEAQERYPDRPESRLARIAALTSEKRNAEAAEAVEEALAAMPPGEDQENLRQHLELLRAQLQLGQGESEAAITALRARVEAEPADLRSWQLLVQAMASAGQAEEAITLLEAELEGEVPVVDLYALLAPLYAAVGRAEEAEAALRTLAASSGSPAGVLPLVQLLAGRNDSEGVEAALRDGIERFPEDAQLRVPYVEALIDRGDLAAARSEAEAYAALPGATEAWSEYLRARFELAEGDAAGAAERLRRLAPTLDLASTHYWLGRALEESGDVEGARRRYGLAQLRDPSWLVPSFTLLALDGRRGAWEAVAGTASQLVKRAPGQAEGWLALCRALTELEQAEPLLQVADQAIAVFPDRPRFRLARAHALRMLGRGEEAVAELDALAEAGSDDPSLAAERAVALAMTGRMQEGMAAAHAAAEAHPSDGSVQAALATLHFASGDAEGGSRAVDRALELRPEDPAPLLDRCRFRTATGDWDGAVDDCTRYLAVRPEDARAHFLIGAAEDGRGRPAEAIAAYRRAAELDQRDFRAPNNLAVLLASTGDLDGALEAGQEAYRLSEGNPYVADTLGELYLRKGLVERAIALLEGAHAAAPQMPEAQLHLAQAYARAGRGEEARPLLEGLANGLPSDHALRPQVEEELRAL